MKKQILFLLKIPFFIMYEDLVFKLKSDNFPQEQLIDLQREVSFEKYANYEIQK